MSDPVQLKHERDQRMANVQAALLRWFDAEQIALPWRQGRTPYAVLVSEFMLQQTQRERVAAKFSTFLQRFPDLRSLAEATAADVIRAWAGLGYNHRALRLQQIARRLVDAGKPIPRDSDALRTLPGVGEYTACAISCFAYDEPVACVDTNVRRVLGRIVDGTENLSKATATKLANELLVRSRPGDWNAALMDLGALVCRARAPQCRHCPVAAWCAARPALVDQAVSAERRVAEGRAAYAKGGRRADRAAPFVASDRYLRGRIVAVLRDLPDGGAVTIEDLALRASGMALPPQTERVQQLAERLLREGLIAADVQADATLAYRLPV